MRFAVGFIFRNLEEEQKIEKFMTRNPAFTLTSFSSIDALTVSFPYKNSFSSFIGPKFAYPALNNYLTENY